MTVFEQKYVNLCPKNLYEKETAVIAFKACLRRGQRHLGRVGVGGWGREGVSCFCFYGSSGCMKQISEVEGKPFTLSLNICDYEACCGGDGAGGVTPSPLSPIAYFLLVVIRGFFILNTTTTYPLFSTSILSSWYHALSFEWCRTFVWSEEDVLNEYKMCISFKTAKTHVQYM